jgi:RNA polymerase sigma-70 factor (ECF subfamily)
MTFSAQRRRPPSGSDRTGSTPAVDWIARIRGGDEAAFERMFRAYYDPLCRHVVGYLGNRDAADDVVQGVFARIWDNRAHWVVRDLHHYLYAAVSRGALSYYRWVAVRRRAAPLLTLEAASHAAPAPADVEFEAAELRRRLERAIAALPPRTRAAFVLSRGQGLSYGEVASQMGISPKTVGVHIGRALGILRKTLSP